MLSASASNSRDFFARTVFLDEAVHFLVLIVFFKESVSAAAEKSPRMSRSHLELAAEVLFILHDAVIRIRTQRF